MAFTFILILLLVSVGKLADWLFRIGKRGSKVFTLWDRNVSHGDAEQGLSILRAVTFGDTRHRSLSFVVQI